ncbi:unnamed protein product [Mucor hiemalis]
MPPIDATSRDSQEITDIPIQKATTEILQQAIDLINTIGDNEYTLPSTVMPAGTIGKHIRHVYDHFNLLYNACCDTTLTHLIVDYDIRARNNPSETDRSIATENLKELQLRVAANNIPLQKNLILLAAIDANDETKYEFDSSFGRELFYSCIHAIHHYASIKAICIEQDIKVPKDFGMAPSTLHDQKRTNQ